VCVATAADTRFVSLGIAAPPCFPTLRHTTCSFSGGALLIDELSPTITH